MGELATIVWTVINVAVFPSGPAPYQGDDKVISNIQWRACVEQEVSEQSYLACEEGMTSLAPIKLEPGDQYPSPETFQLFRPDSPATEITEAMVLGWLHARMKETQLEKLTNILTTKLERQLPPVNLLATPDLPWTIEPESDETGDEPETEDETDEDNI